MVSKTKKSISTSAASAPLYSRVREVLKRSVSRHVVRDKSETVSRKSGVKVNEFSMCGDDRSLVTARLGQFNRNA